MYSTYVCFTVCVFRCLTGSASSIAGPEELLRLGARRWLAGWEDREDWACILFSWILGFCGRVSRRSGQMKGQNSRLWYSELGMFAKAQSPFSDTKSSYLAANMLREIHAHSTSCLSGMGHRTGFHHLHLLSCCFIHQPLLHFRASSDGPLGRLLDMGNWRVSWLILALDPTNPCQ